MLDGILVSGIDQGSFLRPRQDQIAVIGDEALGRLLDDVSGRPACGLGVADPFAGQDLPVIAIQGDEPGWVVLMQRCDLIRDYRLEPLVELARAGPVTDRPMLDQARSNSPGYVFLAARPDGAWIVDLRRRAWLPKHLLPSQNDAQSLPDARARKRFRLRIGQRYWRDPVPDDIVRDIQRPLHDALDRSRLRVRLGGHFSEWLAIRDGDKVLVLAILGNGKDRREAETAFEELLTMLKPEVRERLAPESAVVDVDDIAWGPLARCVQVRLRRHLLWPPRRRGPRHAPSLGMPRGFPRSCSARRGPGGVRAALSRPPRQD